MCVLYYLDIGTFLFIYILKKKCFVGAGEYYVVCTGFYSKAEVWNIDNIILLWPWIPKKWWFKFYHKTHSADSAVSHMIRDLETLAA